MSTCLSVALLCRHIVSFDAMFEHQFQAAESHQMQNECVAAALVNLCGWLGWLQAQECFSIEFDSKSVIPQAQSAVVDLPPGTGVVGANLQAQTKSDQIQTADAATAHTAWNGLSLENGWDANSCSTQPNAPMTNSCPLPRRKNGHQNVSVRSTCGPCWMFSVLKAMQR